MSDIRIKQEELKILKEDCEMFVGVDTGEQDDTNFWATIEMLIKFYEETVGEQ